MVANFQHTNKSFTSLVRLIFKHFILFGTILNEIVFLICFLDNSLLMYGNTTDFLSFVHIRPCIPKSPFEMRLEQYLLW
jgi:hypothetical protein